MVQLQEHLAHGHLNQKTLFSLVNATRFYNYNNVSLLLWNKNIEHSFKKAFLCISTLRIKELDFSNETPEEVEEANEIFCPDCGYVYYDENNKWLKKQNKEYEILLKKQKVLNFDILPFQGSTTISAKESTSQASGDGHGSCLGENLG